MKKGYTAYKSDAFVKTHIEESGIMEEAKKDFFIPVCYYFSIVHAVHLLTSMKM